jgi:hypothetical protein
VAVMTITTGGRNSQTPVASRGMNVAMPNIGLYSELLTHFEDTKHFSYPSKNDPEYQQRNIWLWMAGADSQVKK